MLSHTTMSPQVVGDGACFRYDEAMIFLASVWLPTTAGGWVALLGGILSALVIVVGAVVGIVSLLARTGRAHINRRMDITMEDQVKETVEECLAPAITKLDVLASGREEDRVEIKQTSSRVISLEATINNGLTHLSQKTADDVDEMKIQVAQMYGWMKATHGGVAWDGSTERRT